MYPRKFDLTDTLAANKNNDINEKNRNSKNSMWIAAVTGSTCARVHNRERDCARSCTIAFRAQTSSECECWTRSVEMESVRAWRIM